VSATGFATRFAAGSQQDSVMEIGPKGTVWLTDTVVCLLAAPHVQLSVKTDNV